MHRKTNKAKRVDHGCRNHGTCKQCLGNRTHAARRRILSAAEQQQDAREIRKP